MRAGLTLLPTVCAQLLFAQPKDLELYYPDEDTPPVVLNVLVHVLHCTQSNPRNYKVSDTNLIRGQLDLVNRFYREMYQPTLKPPRADVPFIPDSKIRFKISGYRFYVDSVDWNRAWLAWGEKREIDSVIAEKQEFLFKSNRAGMFKDRKPIVVLDSDLNNGEYTFVKSYYDGKYTHIQVKEEINSSVKKGEISFRAGDGNNCSDNLYKKYAEGADTLLHIFLTGASYSDLGFGCGPSFRFLNMTNMHVANNWAGAQLMAHELGHCIGLSHTDYPQFDDLPKRDRFGWLDCDTIDVSNNIMGYNKCRSYLSPKQIAHVHRLYSTDKLRVLTTVNYKYHPDKTTYTYRGKNTWERNIVLSGDLVVRKNSKLVIKGQVHVPQGASIYLEDGATLEIDGGTLTNYAGLNWKGIVYCRAYKSTKPFKKKGKVSLLNNGKIELNTF